VPPKRVMVIYGTRPEAIKLAPVIKALSRCAAVEVVPVVTAQHRAMLDQVNQLFEIEPKFDLDIIQPRQTLAQVTTRALDRLTPVLEKVNPDAIVVQGDTTTTFVGALAGFYHRVPIAHVEAGLRTGNRYSPFPEEINRQLTTRLTNLHLAPTSGNRNNLLVEGVSDDDVVVTGNTVIDALLEVVQKPVPFSDPDLADMCADGRRVILVTAHRRESWGEPMSGIGRALARVAGEEPDVLIVLPAHRNPVVRERLLPALSESSNVLVTEPLPYGEFATLMNRADLLITDSGGVQEEGPSLGKPVLVMRETTERPEAVHAGTVKLVGAHEQSIVTEALTLLRDATAYSQMANAVNPYGDGHAAERCVAAIAELLGVGNRLEPFSPAL
jgi:UDP-N-acetylglucosamine 2-epimerase (non-hydrolysing)